MAILKSSIPQGQGMSWCLVRLRDSQACEKTLTSATFLSFRFLEATHALCPGSFLEQLASLRGHELPKLVDFHILHLHQSSQKPLQSVWAQLERSCKSFQRSRKSFKPHRKGWRINLKLACFLKKQSFLSTMPILFTSSEVIIFLKGLLSMRETAFCSRGAF